jgi:exoribonuclease R
MGDVTQGYDYRIMSRMATGHWKRKVDRDYSTSISDVDLMESDRIEYTHPFTISIDPDNCVDVDDAISIHNVSENMYEVGIHIADPTSYIIEDSSLDLEGLNRSESIYLQETSHMYPVELTTNVFSLREGEDSRAFSILFEFDSDKSIITNVRFEKTIVRLNSNSTYDAFEEAVQTDSIENHIYRVGLHLHSKFLSGDDYDSKKMVQAFMVYANSLVADRLVQSTSLSDQHIIIRSQARTDYALNTSFVDFAEGYISSDLLNYHTRLKWKNAILKVYADNTVNDQHQGVGLDLYTHFTSPIRRYSDILVHRMLWNAIKDKKFFNLTTLQTNAYLRTLFMLNHNKKFYKDMARFERDWKLYDAVQSDSVLTFEGRVISVDELRATVLIDRCIDNDELTTLFKDLVFRASLANQKMIDSLTANSGKTINDIFEYQKAIISTKYINHDYDESYSTTVELFKSITISVIFTKDIRRYKAYL